MSLKPVWAVLATEAPLAEICASGPELFSGLDIVAARDDGCLYVSRALPDGKAGETQLILRELSGNLEGVGWEPDDKARFAELGHFRSALTLEARDVDIAAQVIARLSARTALAIDNDNGEILSGTAFNGLAPDRQKAFLVIT